MGGATLSLNGLGSGNAIGLGNSFVILDNTGAGAISGTFAGLSQGSSIIADGSGVGDRFVRPELKPIGVHNHSGCGENPGEGIIDLDAINRVPVTRFPVG